MSYVQGLYKKEVRKSNELVENIEVLQEEIRKKEKILLNLNQEIEHIMKQSENFRKKCVDLDNEKTLIEKQLEQTLSQNKKVLFFIDFH